MASLSASLVERTLKDVDIVYLDRSTAKWWNRQRSGPHEPAALCGFFWIRADLEAGPFKSRSAAIRDAYYRIVLGTQPPPTGAFVDQSKRRNTPVGMPTYREWAKDE